MKRKPHCTAMFSLVELFMRGIMQKKPQKNNA
jgi:hypothetical protein